MLRLSLKSPPWSQASLGFETFMAHASVSWYYSSVPPGPAYNGLFSDFSKDFYFVEFVLALLVSEAYTLLVINSSLMEISLGVHSQGVGESGSKENVFPIWGNLAVLEALF